MIQSRRLLATTLALLLPLILVSGAFPMTTHAQNGVMRPHPNGRYLATPDGKRFFALGYNYEGPADRAWKLWERFDAGLVDADLQRARGGGANTVRIFVQNPLPSEIMAGDFSKLDSVINSAARQGLYVLLTLYDYGERDLNQVNEVNKRIAARYRGNSTIMAYDLRNEPQFLTLATTTYPQGVVAPIQTNALVATYGERVAMSAIPAWRSSADGRVLPANWNDQQVYAYANNLAYFREFVAASEQWSAAGPGRTVIDFPASPEAQPWQPFWAAMDGTLTAWISVQRDALRSVDPEHMLTIGWSNLLFARLPANGALLDFMSLHRFPKPGAGSVNQIFQLSDSLRRAFPNRPLMLEEIGFSTAEIDADGAAALEMATAAGAYSRGLAGFLKWMLTDLPPVGNPREDNFGALRVDGSPKPIWHAFGAFNTYLANSAAEPGGSTTVADSGDGPIYNFTTSDASYVSGRSVGGVGFAANFPAPGQLLLRKRGPVLMLATQPGQVTLTIPDLMPTWNGGPYVIEQRAGDGWAAVTGGNSASVTFDIQPTTAYRLSLPSVVDAVGARQGCQFFPETGHNLCGAFLDYWQRNGGLAIFGYPLTEEFPERSKQDGKSYTVQYFERNRFEFHPELVGTPYAVLLGLLGNDLTANRRAEEPFVAVGPAQGRDFFPETGHTLGGSFRSYWQRNGGLAIFGYPTSEEFQEYNPADGRIYTVQYFERNRFEYHPENAGTPYEVLLGLLGNQTVDGNGWRR